MFFKALSPDTQEEADENYRLFVEDQCYVQAAGDARLQHHALSSAATVYPPIGTVIRSYDAEIMNDWLFQGCQTGSAPGMASLDAQAAIVILRNRDTMMSNRGETFGEQTVETHTLSGESKRTATTTKATYIATRPFLISFIRRLSKSFPAMPPAFLVNPRGSYP